ncbi:hypothetical protein Bca52824_038528 [Brassica carinata]|uniref:Uncharacterized protein n=2 Tax=Brassica TaxID=3705 RepID=A0A8X7RMK5_BRACI|nr:hypothetical protein Bca52824_038528 [Brassica carinata]VDD00504.1 unnamed protein product [Brassica oleracea]
MKLCTGRTSVIDVAFSVAQKRSELARNSVNDAIASMVRNRSTVVFYYSSSDRFTTTDPSLGRENRIKRSVRSSQLDRLDLHVVDRTIVAQF